MSAAKKLADHPPRAKTLPRAEPPPEEAPPLDPALEAELVGSLFQQPASRYQTERRDRRRGSR